MNIHHSPPRFLLMILLLCVCPRLSHGEQPKVAATGVKDQPTVVFITGDDEYRSREIMLPFAEKLEQDYGFKVTYLKDEAGCAHRKREPNELIGAERIKEADLMVLFVRFRSWEPKSLKLFMDHFESGKPAVAIRTSTHAFWEDKTFPPIYFGGHYKNHPHRQIVCQINPEHASHPITRGVDMKFAENEGPYLTTPLTEGATPILLAYGTRNRDPNNIIGDDSFDSPTTPAAWAFDHNGARRAMITLMSYRVDSQNKPYSQNLFYNSVFWALGYGAIYRQTAPLIEASLPAGQWQSYDITLKDNRVTVLLNGKEIHRDVELKHKTPYGFPVTGSGPIRLQGECSAVRFANIAIREIE